MVGFPMQGSAYTSPHFVLTVWANPAYTPLHVPPYPLSPYHVA